MKRFFKFISVLFAISAIAAFAGCNTEEETSEAAPTIVSLSSGESDYSENEREFDLSSLNSINSDGDVFAGFWRITGGVGAKLESFLFMFDGNGNANLVIGSMGYCGKYELTTETLDDGTKRDVFITHLIYGLDGNYTYDFSEDGYEVVLTNTEDSSTTTMEKVDSYSIVPMPDSDSVIDKNLVGAWKSGDGEYLYFDESGIMYDLIRGMSFTYSTYSAKDGIVTSSYYMLEKQESQNEYSVDGDILIYNGYEYSKTSVSELLES